MNYVLVFRPEVRKELDEAYSWYESQELGLGDDFLEQVDEALDRICPTSSWIEGGIKLQKIRGLNLFKFTDELQMRLEMLIDRQKSNLLTSEETAELVGITELDHIFTLMNAHIIAES